MRREEMESKEKKIKCHKEQVENEDRVDIECVVS